MASVSDLRNDLTNVQAPQRGIEEPIAAPDLFAKKLHRFPEELYNLHQDSHLYRFLLAICGDGGAGSLKKELLYSKLQSTLASTHFHDLDRLYGDPLGLPRISSEFYTFDPKDQNLTVNEWVEVYAKDANYRNRCLIWMRAIFYGASIMGMKLAAEAACGIECDIFAVTDYLTDLNSDHPTGVVNLGQTVSDGEFVIVPRINALTNEEKHRIIAMVDRIRPVDTLVTISLGNTIRTQKIPATVESTSDFTQIIRLVTGRVDVEWPEVGGPPSENYILNGSFENSISSWLTVTGGFITTGATLTATASSVSVRALFGSYVGKVATPGGATHEGARTVNLLVFAGIPYTFSVYVKSDAAMNLDICVGDSTVGTQTTAFQSTTTWKRVSVTFTPTNTGYAQCAVRTTGTTAGNFYLDGAQFEKGTAPTTFIPNPTIGATGKRRNVPSTGRWIEPGIEKEAPTYAWLGRQETATFLDIVSATSSSEHIGDFNRTQTDLFAHLSNSTEPSGVLTDGQFYTYSGDYAYTKAFSQIGLTTPWQRNDMVLVNTYYPLEYLQTVDLAQFNVSPTHRFWASQEKYGSLKASNLLAETTEFTTTPFVAGQWRAVRSTASKDDTVRHNNLTTLKVTTSGDPLAICGLEQFVTEGVNESMTLNYHFWFKGPAGIQHEFAVNYLTAANGYINTFTDTFTANGDWQEITGTFTTDLTTARLQAGIYMAPGEVSTFWVNEVAVYAPNDEWLKFDLGRNRPVNYVDFEISQKPVTIKVETSTDDINYTEVTPTDGTDYAFDISYLVSDQPWRFFRLYFTNTTARYIRVSFTRRDDPFPFGTTTAFRWSVDVRNFRAVHLIQTSSDFVADSGTDILGNAWRSDIIGFSPLLTIDGLPTTFWISQPNPVPYAVEALYFDVSTTTHGVTMGELDTGLGGGGNTMKDYDTIPMSGFESSVTLTVGAQVVDEIFIDPVFSGCDMHFYWSTDPTPEWEGKLWHPIPRHYKCTRGFHALPYPVTARYFKVEFSNLTAVPYNTLDYPQLLPPLYRKFPTWVQNYFAALTPEALNALIDEGQSVTIDPYDMFKIQQDLLATTRDQSDLVREEEPDTDVSEISQIATDVVNLGDETVRLGEETKINFFPPTFWRDDLKDILDLSRAGSRLIWQDEEEQFMIETTPEILDAPSEQSAEDLSAEVALKKAPTMWFPRICRHGYQVVTGPFQSKIAYQVAIREVSFWYRGASEGGNSEYGVSTYGGSYYG